MVVSQKGLRLNEPYHSPPSGKGKQNTSISAEISRIRLAIHEIEYQFLSDHVTLLRVCLLRLQIDRTIDFRLWELDRDVGSNWFYPHVTGC